METSTDPSDRPFSLELSQRDLLNATDAPMPFNRETIGSALRDIAARVSDIKSSERLFLGAVADALDNPNAEWRLSLARTVRGKFVPPDQHADQQERDALVEYWMNRALDEYGKVEAAVADVAARMKISRANIFESLKRRREFIAMVEGFKAENLGIPRKG